jgi:hypothetical protein
LCLSLFGVDNISLIANVSFSNPAFPDLHRVSSTVAVNSSQSHKTFAGTLHRVQLFQFIALLDPKMNPKLNDVI